MKRLLTGLVFLAILGSFTACENPGGSEDLEILTPTNPGSISFMYQTVHTQQYVLGTWTSNIEYPVVTIISSGLELEQYHNDYEDKYDFLRHQHSTNGFMDAIERYSDAFFADSFLVLVLLEETSGFIRHRVERIDENGDIVITRLVSDGPITADMAQWHIIIELEKTTDLQAKNYNVVFLDSLVDG